MSDTDGEPADVVRIAEDVVARAALAELTDRINRLERSVGALRDALEAARGADQDGEHGR